MFLICVFFFMQQVHITDTVLEELTFFTDASEEVIISEELLKKNAMALLLKRSSENLSNAIDDVVAQMVYGNLRKPPGDENCPYQKLTLKKEDVEFPGLWTPPNSLCKAMGLKWFFPTVSGPFRLPEEQPVPPHVVVGYDAFKYKEVMELSAQYPDAIMKYGFFSSDIPGEGELITKTVEKFEKKMTPTTYEEKIVIQLVKNSDWWSAFLELGPSYISPNTVDGEEDAKIFFPPTYDIPEEVIMAVKKKPKKKGKGKFVAVMEAHENEILQSDKQTTTEVPDESEELNLGEDADGQSTEDKTIEEDEDDEGIDETDKATSPMDNATTEDGN